MKIRPYQPSTDYPWIKALYIDNSTYGGQYDDARDAPEKLAALVATDMHKILIAEIQEQIVGTVTLFEDGRAAWLYRFAVQADHEQETAQVLYDRAVTILKQQWHSQVLVYASASDKRFAQRYGDLGMHQGGDYTCFWSDI